MKYKHKEADDEHTSMGGIEAEKTEKKFTYLDNTVTRDLNDERQTVVAALSDKLGAMPKPMTANFYKTTKV